MATHRCPAPGCGRFVQTGSPLSGRHVSTDALAIPEDTSPPSKPTFEERLATGEYTALFDKEMRQVMTQAAMAASEHGLAEEIGALRVALSRVVNEEKDASKLAAGVARVASTAVQVARAHRALAVDATQSLAGALADVLAELDEG